ncbi:MAG: hypothetical protein P8H59_13130 [Flavobacteriales bacterium]|nr:hypothetical protein [Flavobacteriales bacterium]MDG1781895.1 hypothetical protein [Flavobacteriales bacterium]MDG2246904.1 hypothetical protein [Flavobacteriales bacterium]
MQQSNALLLLGLETTPSESDLVDLVEEKVFEIRTYFLRQTIVPELYRSRAKKLVQFGEAARILGLTYSPTIFPNYEGQAPETLPKLLTWYGSGVAYYRFQLSSTLNPFDLENIVEQLISHQINFEDAFYEASKTVDMSEETIPASQAIDYAVLQSHLRLGENELAQVLIAQERKRIDGRYEREGKQK